MIMSAFFSEHEKKLANETYLNEIQFRKDEFGNRLTRDPNYAQWVEDERVRLNPTAKDENNTAVEPKYVGS